MDLWRLRQRFTGGLSRQEARLRLTMRGGRGGLRMRRRLRWRILMRIAGRGWIGWGNIQRLREGKLVRWDFVLEDIWHFARRFSRMSRLRFVIAGREFMTGSWGTTRMRVRSGGRRRFAGNC